MQLVCFEFDDAWMAPFADKTGGMLDRKVSRKQAFLIISVFALSKTFVLVAIPRWMSALR